MSGGGRSSNSLTTSSPTSNHTTLNNSASVGTLSSCGPCGLSPVMAVLQKPTEPQQSEYLALECGRSMAEGVPVSTLFAWLRTCYGGAERTAEAAPAEIERYFVECERLCDQGA